jgi:hypothetical protein
MLSVTPQHSDGNHPRPHLINSAHDDIIWRLAYLPDGRRVATGSSDGTVKVWNLENGEQEGTSIEHESQICGLAVTRDGTNIVSVDGDGKIKVWDVKSHEIVKEWTHPESWPEISISPDDRHIAVGAWTVAIYTMEGGQVIHSIEVGQQIVVALFLSQRKENSHVALVTTSACMTSTVAHSSFKLVCHRAIGSVMCCGPATAVGSSLAQTTRRLAVGTPIQENESDIRGQVIRAAYAPFPFPQMDQSLRARPLIKPFVSGMQLLVIPPNNSCNTMNKSTPFVSLPPVNPWHQQDGMERHIYGG